MTTAQEFIKAIEDYAISSSYYHALVRECNELAEDVATYEPNTPAHEAARQLYERILTAASSAQTAMLRYEVDLLKWIHGDRVEQIEAAMDRLRIGGGSEAARAIMNQLENRYIEQSRIPEEAR